jgi:hypothetical protein
MINILPMPGSCFSKESRDLLRYCQRGSATLGVNKFVTFHIILLMSMVTRQLAKAYNKLLRLKSPLIDYKTKIFII